MLDLNEERRGRDGGREVEEREGGRDGRREGRKEGRLQHFCVYEAYFVYKRYCFKFIFHHTLF